MKNKIKFFIKSTIFSKKGWAFILILWRTIKLIDTLIFNIRNGIGINLYELIFLTILCTTLLMLLKLLRVSEIDIDIDIEKKV